MSVVRKAGFHILRGFRWQESWNLIPLPLGHSQPLKVLQSTICYIMLHCCIFLGNNYESRVCCQWVDMFNRFLPFRCFEYSSGGLPVCQLVFHLGRQVGAVQGRLRCECTPGRALGTLGNFCNCLSKKMSNSWVMTKPSCQLQWLQTVAKSRCPWRPVVSGRLRCSIAFWPMQMALPWGLCHFSECRLFRLILFFVPKAIKVWMGSRLGAYPLYECENNISISRTYLACFWPFSLEVFTYWFSSALDASHVIHIYSWHGLQEQTLPSLLQGLDWGLPTGGEPWALGHCIQEFEILGETFACPLFVCLQAQHLNEFMLAVIGVAALDTVSSTDIYGIKASFLCWSCLKRKQINWGISWKSKLLWSDDVFELFHSETRKAGESTIASWRVSEPGFFGRSVLPCSLFPSASCQKGECTGFAEHDLKLHPRWIILASVLRSQGFLV